MEYTSENMIGEKMFESESFFKDCPDICWERDVFPAISCFSPEEIVSFTISIFFERSCKATEINGEKFVDDNTSTKAEIQMMLRKNNDILSLKRNLYSEGILTTDNMRKKILKEIDYIKQYYLPFSVYSVANPMAVSIILPAGIGGIFVHEAIGHCLEADLYFKKDNILNGYLGKKITNNKSIIISDSCCNSDILKYKISDDGAIPSSITLVRDGNLENIMTDAFFSSIFGIMDTGNGRASDFYNFPLPRMRNTYIHNGSDKVNDIITHTKNGVIPIEIQGGNVAVESGNFMFNISHALIVKNGSIVGISKPFLYTGNIIDALDSIEMIGDDLKFCRAVCGKRGQLIDVVYGSPTILISQRRIHE